MSNSIVFISKPSVIHSDLPKTKPANFANKFSFEISKPVNASNTALVVELCFFINSDGALKTSFGFATHSICEIETKHSESESYILLDRAIKIVVDNFKEMFVNMDLQGYTEDVSSLIPYPKSEVVIPVLREIFNPVIGFTIN